MTGFWPAKVVSIEGGGGINLSLPVVIVMSRFQNWWLLAAVTSRNEAGTQLAFGRLEQRRRLETD